MLRLKCVRLDTSYSGVTIGCWALVQLGAPHNAAQVPAEFCQCCITNACETSLEFAELGLNNSIYALLKPVQAIVYIMRGMIKR